MNVPKLRFKEFNDEWNYELLDNLIDIKSNTYNPTKDNKNYKCIELEHINQNSGTINGFIDSIEQKSNKNIFKKGEVLFGKLRPYLKKYWFAEFDGVCSSEIWVARSKNEKLLNNKFIFNIFQSHYFLQLCNLSTGSKMPRADWSFIKEQSIPIPSLNEQNKISNTLQLLNKKIELQTKKIEDLKLFKLCTAKIIFKDDSLLCKKQLKELCNIVKGKQINSEFLSETGEYYMLNGGINPSGFINEYNTNENTISISEGGNSCGYVNFNKSKFWAGGHCYTITPIDINNIYLYQILKYNENKIMDLRVGSGLPNIQKKDLENFLINVHRSNMQNKIATILSSIDKLIDLEEKKISSIEKLKKGLMQNMFV